MQFRYTGHLYDRTFALVAGQIQPEGTEFEYITGRPKDIFRRVFAGEVFEGSELSLSNYIIQRARGEEQVVALPIFPSRVFRHNTVWINTRAGVERPEDLLGKTIGLREYNITANFWVRAFLQHDYGVAPSAVRWLRAEPEKLNLTPPGVEIAEMPPGRSPSELLEAGEIAALIWFGVPECAAAPHVRRLFPDFGRAEADYYQRTGHFPIMHTVVLRRDVYERDCSLARRVYDAFQAAKEQSYARTRDVGSVTTDLPLQHAYLQETRAIFGDDPFPYGVAQNRQTVEALAQYVHEQGFADRALTMEDLFAPELLDT